MSELKPIQEPKGIAFYSVKSDDTHYAKLEPTIAAYINSSDMGINASRGQDFGWRLAPEWVTRVRNFRKDSLQMQILTAKNGGRKPNTVQILYYLYGEDVRAFEEELEENENPFEESYRDKIADKPLAQHQETPDAAALTPLPDTTPAPAPVVPESPLTEPLAPREEDDDAKLDAAAEAATSDQPPTTAS